MTYWRKGLERRQRPVGVLHPLLAGQIAQDSEIAEILLAKIRKCDSLIRSPNEAGHGEGEWRRKERRKVFSPGGSRYPLEKGQFREGNGNRRKAKRFSWKNLAAAWGGLARFGKIWIVLETR
jgi:hypothetical protein